MPKVIRVDGEWNGDGILSVTVTARQWFFGTRAARTVIRADGAAWPRRSVIVTDRLKLSSIRQMPEAMRVA